MRRAWLVCVALAAAAAPASSRIVDKDKPKPATFDDPCVDGDAGGCKRHALDAFRAALAAQRAQKATHPLRVSWFGDSLTADDQITHELRTRLQKLVGDGGPGFVFAAPPHPFCQLRAIGRVASEGWVTHGISTFVPPDHLLGLGGDAECDEEANVKLSPLGTVRSVDVHYLAQPHGGTFELAIDGKVAATIATAGDRKQGLFAHADIPAGAKHLELRARGHVRLFGATLEAPTGAVVDNLGVVNATAKAMRNNDLEDHLKNQLGHRAPDLVIVMYGTNEAEWLRPKGYGMEEHEKLFGELLATLRAGAPASSCLVVSPLDQLDWRDDKMPPRDSIPAMVEAQHRAATAHGCAFWSVYDWMGGKGSSKQWNARGWIVKDFQHPTSEGAERIADALYGGLVSP